MVESVSSVAVVIGPTAAGKTAAAMALQDLLGGPDKAQLISADSALVYRGMDIGTAKPSASELQQYPHQLIDIRDPSESYSAADFVRDADAVVHTALQQGKTPIIVGGTMMYLKCLLQGIADLPRTDISLRGELERELAERSAQSLHEELAQHDPDAAAGIHPNNHQRLLRALSVVRASGQPISAQWRSNAIGTRGTSSAGCRRARRRRARAERRGAGVAHQRSGGEPGQGRGTRPYDCVGAVHVAGVPPLQAVRRRHAERGVHDAGWPGLWS